MSKTKELLDKVRALLNLKFDDMTPAAPPAASMAPPAGTPYTLQDGSTINIVQAGSTPAAGDMVTINGAPAPAGTYTLQDGSTLTTDATGAISAYTPAAPVTADPGMQAPATPPPAAPAMPAAPKFEATESNVKAAIEKMTPESMAALYESFATGNDADRLNNLEVVCRALMEYNFGWQIREAQQKATTDQAIQIYKNDLQTAQAALSKQDKIITNQQQVITEMFTLVEEMSKSPSGDPVTLTGNKKDQFSKKDKAEKRFQGIADSLKKVKEPA